MNHQSILVGGPHPDFDPSQPGTLSKGEAAKVSTLRCPVELTGTTRYILYGHDMGLSHPRRPNLHLFIKEICIKALLCARY